MPPLCKLDSLSTLNFQSNVKTWVLFILFIYFEVEKYFEALNPDFFPMFLSLRPAEQGCSSWKELKPTKTKGNHT